jgi:ABC-2 type transport system ATP-binding protein
MPILQAIQITKKFGEVQVFSAVNLEISDHEIVALTGSNGAGKSTLLMCLGGLLRLNEGEVQVCGKDLYRQEGETRQDLAYVPDVPRFYTELTAWEHLYFMAQAHHAGEGFEARAGQLLRRYGLWEYRNLYPHHYSRGMSLKLGLLLALIRPFKVLLLDEPTSALDVESKAQLLSHLQDLRSEGAGILMTTHEPAVVEQVADRRILLEKGRLRNV